MKDLCEVMVDFCKVPGCPTSYNKLKSEYAAFNKAVALQQHRLDRVGKDQKNDVGDEVKEYGAFCDSQLALDGINWIETWMENVVCEQTGEMLFNGLAWFAKKCAGVACSASACEHSWSIEGWIHSKRRNRLSQDTVEMLLRGHTNLGLQSALQESHREMLPWDTELTIDEPRYRD